MKTSLDSEEAKGSLYAIRIRRVMTYNFIIEGSAELGNDLQIFVDCKKHLTEWIRKVDESDEEAGS